MLFWPFQCRQRYFSSYRDPTCISEKENKKQNKNLTPFWLLNSPTAGNTTGVFMKRFKGKSQWEVVTAGAEREPCQQGVFSDMAYLGLETQQKGKDAPYLSAVYPLSKNML